MLPYAVVGPYSICVSADVFVAQVIVAPEEVTPETVTAEITGAVTVLPPPTEPYNAEVSVALNARL